MFARRCPTARNRSQPVRECPREVAMAVPMVSFAKGVTFGAFQRSIASFRVAGRGTLRHFNIFHDVSKVVLCGRRRRPPMLFCVAGAAL